MARFPRIFGFLALVAIMGCRTGGSADHNDWRTRGKSLPPIRHIACVFDQRPWLNLDATGDRDVEGIAFRAFLDAGEGRGVLRDGTFHVEMYKIVLDSHGKATRTLVSDWHYVSRDVPKIAKPGRLGEGYFLHLRWASKDVSGHEVEFLTRFEDEEGRTSRSGTKRLRVPKYNN